LSWWRENWSSHFLALWPHPSLVGGCGGKDQGSISRTFPKQFALVTFSNTTLQCYYFEYYTTMFCPFTVIIHCFFLFFFIHTALCLFDFKPISMSCIEVGSNAYLQSWQTLRKCWNVESSWQTLLKEFLCLSHLSIKRAARESWFPIFLIFLICNSPTYFRSILLKKITHLVLPPSNRTRMIHMVFPLTFIIQLCFRDDVDKNPFA